MGMIAQRLNLRLFIDGIEVPVIGARCTFSEGGPSTAEIQVVFTDKFYDVQPRAFVTLFVYEDFEWLMDGQGNRTTKISAYDPRRYKLLFMGELASVGFQRQASQRSAILNCIDTTTYWDSIKQHYVNFKNGGIEAFENAFLGVNLDRVKFFDVTLTDANSNIFNWLTKSKNSAGEANLYLGVQKIIREMFFASSSFYARAFNRLRLGDCIVGITDDTTSAKLVKVDYFAKFIKNQISSEGGMVSLRQLLMTLLGIAFHTFTVVPCPKFDTSGAQLGGIKLEAETQSKILKRAAYPGAALHHVIVKPDTWFLCPPLCNVIFPHQYNSIDFQRDYLTEATRLFLRTELLFTGKDKWLTERFYSPDFKALNEQLYRGGGQLDRLAAVVLPHEDYVGLNPMFTWQNDLGSYVKKGDRRKYLAAISDYLFWKHRFGSRSVSVTGPLNLNLVAGYPGVVLEGAGNMGQLTRHFIGNVQTVVHSVNQDGGWTSVSLVGARIHDEVCDFDGEGRTLEEVTSHGQAGFLDTRYSVDNIGYDVYMKLFGCNSIAGPIQDMYGVLSTDLAKELGSIEQTVDDVYTQSGATIAGVANLQLLYQYVLRNDVNVNDFTQLMTQRPKANMLEMLGRLSGVASTEEASAMEAIMQDVETYGFLSTAVDTSSVDTKPAAEGGNDSYESVEESVRYSSKEVDVTKREKHKIEGKVVEVDVKIGSVMETTAIKTVSKDKAASYGLKSHLEARQEKVLAYIDSLKDRGIRG